MLCIAARTVYSACFNELFGFATTGSTGVKIWTPWHGKQYYSDLLKPLHFCILIKRFVHWNQCAQIQSFWIMHRHQLFSSTPFSFVNLSVPVNAQKNCRVYPFGSQLRFWTAVLCMITTWSADNTLPVNRQMKANHLFYYKLSPLLSTLKSALKTPQLSSNLSQMMQCYFN